MSKQPTTLVVPASARNGPQRDQSSKALSLTSEQANAYQPFGRAKGVCQSHTTHQSCQEVSS